MLDFEKCFGDFLESKEYDRIENEEQERLESVIFAMLRIAYKSGWSAAGGILPESHACNEA